MTEFNPYSPPKAQIEQQPDPNEIESLPLASRTARLGGAIVDGLISIAITIPLFLLTGAWQSAMNQSLSVLETIQLGALGMFFFLVVHGYLLAKRGQTVGKLVAGTRIVSVEADEILPFSKLVGLRYLPFMVISQIPLIGPVANLINILFIFRRDRRCIHDHLAGTRVISDPRVGPIQP